MPIDDGARVPPATRGVDPAAAEGEVLFLHKGTQVYFGLDPVGAEMWEISPRRAKPGAVVSRLIEECDVGEKGFAQICIG